MRLSDLKVEDNERSVHQTVLHRLRTAILRGTFKPGDRLRQEELAVRFGVSRIPIREALSKLEAEGLVINRPHRGAVVVELDLDTIQEFHELRGALEGAVGEIATPLITPDRIDRMDALLGEMATLGATTEELQAWVARNREFHFTLYHSSRRPHFIRLIENYFHHTNQNINLYVAVQPAIQRANAEHRAIFEAVRERKPIVVRREIERHIIDSGVRLISYLRGTIDGPSD